MFKGILTHLSPLNVKGHPHTPSSSKCPRLSSLNFLLQMSKGILTQLSPSNVQGHPHLQMSSGMLTQLSPLNVQGCPHTLFFPNVQRYPHTIFSSMCSRVSSPPNVPSHMFFLKMSKGILTQLPPQHVPGYPRTSVSSQCVLCKMSKELLTQCSPPHVQRYHHTLSFSICPRVSSHRFLLDLSKGISTQVSLHRAFSSKRPRDSPYP